MGKEEIECVLCKTYSHSVLSVTAIMLPLTLCVLVARGACECSGFLFCNIFVPVLLLVLLARLIQALYMLYIPYMFCVCVWGGGIDAL